MTNRRSLRSNNFPLPSFPFPLDCSVKVQNWSHVYTRIIGVFSWKCTLCVPSLPQPLQLCRFSSCHGWNGAQNPSEVFARCVHGLRLSPIAYAFGNPNSKYVSNTIPIASNKISIQKTHFGYQGRHNPNLGILSPRDPFAESVVF